MTGSTPEASAISLPPLLLRLLPAGATVAGWVSHPLKTCAFPRRTEKCGLMKRIDKLTEKELQALHQNFLSCTNIRETEAALRQHLGLSKSKAKQHAGPMFQHNQEARETLRQAAQSPRGWIRVTPRFFLLTPTAEAGK